MPHRRTPQTTSRPSQPEAGCAGGSGGVDVLLVEDETELATATCDYLEAFGVSTAHRASAEAALADLADLCPRVVLADVRLPGMSGFALCSRLREQAQARPIILVSARTTEADQVLGLDLGADDYLTKPYSLQVLLAKVRRALRRAGAPGASAQDGSVPGAGADAYDDGHLRVDLEAGRTWVDGQEVRLTGTEHRILTYLLRHRGRVCSKQEIIKAVWGDPFTSEGTLTVHVRRLRTRIETDPDAPARLRTVWGRGYLFEAGP